LNVRTPFFLRQDLCQFWWGSPIISDNDIVAKMTRHTWGYWGMLRLTSQRRQSRRNEYTWIYYISESEYIYIAIFLYYVCSLDYYITVWWFGAFFIFPYIGNNMFPTDFHSLIFQRGRFKPPTRLLLTIINHIITININHILIVYYQPMVGSNHQAE
jgi:hypothetical protein